MSVYDKDKIKKHLDLLIGEIIRVKSKFELYVHIQNSRQKRFEELNISPAFFTLTLDALLTDTLISLSRIYEKEHNSDFNLLKFLNVVEQNKQFLCKKQITQQTMESHRKKIVLHNRLIDNLLKWQDKHYNQLDEKYFFDSNKLSQEARLNIGSIRVLIVEAEEILNEYSIALENKTCTFEAWNNFDIDKVLDILHKYKQNPLRFL